MQNVYEEELDELLMSRNPLGGRPQGIGSLVFNDPDGQKTYEVSQIKENSTQRFLLGYCFCGRKVVIGEKRASMLLAALKRRGIEERRLSVPLRVKLARSLVSGLSTGEY